MDTNYHEKKNKEDQNWSALSFAWELGYIIAIPLVLGAVIGRVIDSFFGTTPVLFLTFLFLSIVGTVILVLRKTMTVLKSFEEKSEKSKKEKKKFSS